MTPSRKGPRQLASRIARPLLHARKRRVAATGAAGLVVLAALGVSLSLVGDGPSRPAKRPITRNAASDIKRPTTTTSTAPPTSLGPDGVQSTAIEAENDQPGSSDWPLTNSPGPGFIEGFADRVDAQAGDTVGLYVSTDAPSFVVDAYRMGYYGGAGAREVWSSDTVSGTQQPACPVTPVTNMVACDNWIRSTTFSVSPAFVPGDYLLKLVSSTGKQSFVLLTVSDPTSHAAYLFVARSLTEEGWNSYGGFDYYQGKGPCPPGTPTYPVCNRARVVSFDRPYAEGSGPADFLANEYPLVRFSEQHGLDATYTTDVTLDEHPELFLAHRAVLSLGHDETWTSNERRGVEAALAQGVNIAFFGSAAVLRHSRLQSSPIGPDREEVDYRDQTEDPLNGKGDPLQVTGNTFSSPPTNWPETRLVGELYSGYTNPGTAPVPFVVFDPTAWIFKGTGLGAGAAVPGVVDSDFDHVDPAAAQPDLQVLGHSPVPLSQAYTNQGQWGSNTYSDMTYYTSATSKGGVWDSGTVNWINALSSCPASTACPAPLVGQMTGNLLWLFGQGPAGTIVPSVANWQSVDPKGS